MAVATAVTRRMKMVAAVEMLLAGSLDAAVSGLQLPGSEAGTVQLGPKQLQYRIE